METAGSLFLSLNFENGTLPSSIELIPAGTLIQGRDGRKWKNSQPQKVAHNSMARLSRLVIDENHATDLAAPKGGASPAMGWMTGLRAGQDGSIRADVEWTKRGEEAVLNREYSFISPVFLHDGQGEITVVLRAALTNSPNLQLPALNSEQGSDGEPEKNNTEDCMDKELCAALGLSETATVNDALAVIDKLKTAQNAAQSVDLAAYAPRAELNAALERAISAEKQAADLNAAQLKKEAEAAVDGAIKEGKIPPALKDTYIAMCATHEGLKQFKEIAAKTPAIIDGKPQAPAGTPAASVMSLNAEDAAFAKAAGYSIEEWEKIKEAGK
ncbi:MAG: phage protease [Treponema sp.]|jgi:phage I-like protein|nr:phage protease [Treponema sp.]